MGAFDIISEFLPHLTIILYRVYPTSHAFLRKIFRIAAITTFTGTIAETILTMFLFGSLWDRWTLAFKVTTPMLHLVFMAAQLWGTWNFIGLYKRQGVLLREQEKRDEEEGGRSFGRESADGSLSDEDRNRDRDAMSENPRLKNVPAVTGLELLSGNHNHRSLTLSPRGDAFSNDERIR
ncbi:hypothetical protein NHQ30_011031 [Ciborinia camelliae]|nr:hypothetical protein NHQ30_011031 [Ciborinia camelliae]